MAISTSKENTTQTETNNLVLTGAIREKLTGSRTYYVDPTGLDSNDGLTPGTAFLTPIKACDVIMNDIDLAGFQVTVQFADGTYDDINPAFSFIGMARLYGLTSNDLSFAGAVTFRGNPGTPANVIFRLNDGNYAFDFAGINSSIVVDGFTITKLPAATSLAGGFSTYEPSGFINVQNIRFDDTPGAVCFFATDGGRLNISGDIELVAGSRLNIIQATNGATVNQFSGTDIEFLAGAHTIVDDVVCCIRGAYVQLGGSFTETGTVTGRPFQVARGASFFNLTTSGDIPGSGTPIVDDNTFLTENATSNEETGIQFNNKIREKLTAARTYFVATTGSDLNDGLTVGTAFATIQHAIDIATCTLDLAGFVVTIQIEAGTYNESDIRVGDLLCGARGGAELIIKPTTPGTVTINSSTGNGRNFTLLNDASVIQVEGLILQSTTFNIVVASQGEVIINGCTFETTGATGSCIFAIANCFVTVTGATTLNSTALDSFIQIILKGFARLSSGSVTLNAGTPPTFTSGFVRAIEDSTFILSSTSFINSAVGNKFAIRGSTHIETNTNDLNALPGDTPGTFEPSCSYDSFTRATGVNVETLGGAKSLNDAFDLQTQILDPGGANRDVNLPTGPTVNLKNYLVVNPTGSGFDLVLKDGVATVSTITSGNSAAVVYDGTNWILI